MRTLRILDSDHVMASAAELLSDHRPDHLIEQQPHGALYRLATPGVASPEQRLLSFMALPQRCSLSSPALDLLVDLFSMLGVVRDRHPNPGRVHVEPRGGLRRPVFTLSLEAGEDLKKLSDIRAAGQAGDAPVRSAVVEYHTGVIHHPQAHAAAHV